MSIIRSSTFWICVSLAAATMLAYWPVLHYPFVNFDDLGYLIQNPQAQAGLRWETVKWAFKTFLGGNWHPLTWFSHALDCQLYGLNAGRHHFTSVILHCFSSVLLFLFLQTTTRAAWRSAFVAGLFALHPTHVESVAWVAERKDVLSTFFFMLTLLAYGRFAGAQSKVPGRLLKNLPGEGTGPTGTLISDRNLVGRVPSRGSVGVFQQPASLKSKVGEAASRYYWVSLTFFAFGLMSKPMLVTTPFVLLLLDFWPLQRWKPKVFRPTSSVESTVEVRKSKVQGQNTASDCDSTFTSLVLEKVPFFVLSVAASVLTIIAQKHSEAVASLGVVDTFSRITNALLSYVQYCEKLVWPTGLAVYYPYRESPSTWSILAAGGILAGVTGFALWPRGGSTQSSDLGRLIPRRPPVAIGWLWFLGTLVPVIGLVQVGLQSMADRYTYIPSIGFFIAVTWLCYELLERGPLKRGESTADAGHRNAALPRYIIAGCAITVLCVLLALTRYQVQFWRDSETLWRRAISIAPNNPIALGNLGSALVEQTRFEEAAEHFIAALRIKPGYAEAESNLGFVRFLQGRTEDAIAHYRRALSIKPNMERTHFLLGNVLLAMGQQTEAIGEYEAALQLNPDWPAALNDLAWILATSPNDALRNGVRAVSLAERACRVTAFRNPQFIGTLAAALAEAGRFEDAVNAANQAIKTAQSAERRDLAERNQELLQLYQQNKPFRESY